MNSHFSREELYEEWLHADQGMDMSWEEYQAWNCLNCKNLRGLLNNCALRGHEHGV